VRGPGHGGQARQPEADCHGRYDPDPMPSLSHQSTRRQDDQMPLPATRPAARTGELAEPSSQPEVFIRSLTFSQLEIDGRPPESKGSIAPGVMGPSVAELGFVRAVFAPR